MVTKYGESKWIYPAAKKKYCGPERSTLSVVHGILVSIQSRGVFQFQINPLGPRQEGFSILLPYFFNQTSILH